jgi:hypothetical protein
LRAISAIKFEPAELIKIRPRAGSNTDKRLSCEGKQNPSGFIIFQCRFHRNISETVIENGPFIETPLA